MGDAIRALRKFLVFVGITTAFVCVHADDKLSKAERDSLNSGRIPQTVRENNRIIPQAKTPGFQKEMEKLFIRLFPDHDLKQYPIKFFVMDSEKPGRTAFVTERFGYFGITTAMLKELKTQDGLAYILADEIIATEMLVPDARSAEVRGERGRMRGEALGATQAIDVIHSAGFDPEVVMTIQEILEKQPKLDRWIQYKANEFFRWDVENRRSFVEKRLSKLRSDRGDLSKERTALSDVVAVSGSKRHESVIGKALQRAGFEKLGFTEKLEVIHAQIAKLRPGHTARLEDLEAAIMTLERTGEIESYDDPRWIALSKVGDELLSKRKRDPNNVKGEEDVDKQRAALYGAVSSRYEKKGSPLGKAYQLHEYAEEFVEYVTEASRLMAKGQVSEANRFRSQAIEAAQDFLKELESSGLDANALKNLNIATFRFPKKGEVVDWEAGIEWAGQSIKHGGDIAKTLYLLGINEIRVFPMMDVSDRARFLMKGQARVSVGPTGEGGRVDGIVIGVGGEVVDFRSNFSDQHRLNRAELLSEYIPELFERAVNGDKDALLLVQSAARDKSVSVGSELLGLEHLDKHYDLVLEVNRGLLGDGGQHGRIARQKLISEFKRGLQEDKKKWGPRIRQFYLGNRRGRYFGLNDIGMVFDKQDSVGNGLPVGMELVQFALKNKHGLFNRRELEAIWGRTSILEGGKEGNHPPSEQLDPLRAFYGYSTPTTVEELYAAVKKAGKVREGLHSVLVTMEVAYFIENHPEVKERLPNFRTENQLDPIRILPYMAKNWGNTGDTVITYFEDRVPLPEDWPEEIKELLPLYTAYDRANVLPQDGTVKDYIVERILDEIEKLGPKVKQMRALEDVMEGPRVTDPELRAKVFKKWAGLLAEVHGKDDKPDKLEQKNYRDKILMHLERVGGYLQSQDRHDLFNMTANAVLSQEELSLKIGELRELTRGASDMGLMGLQLGAELIRHDSSLRDTLEEFLTTARTDQSVQDMSSALMQLELGTRETIVEDQKLYLNDEWYERLARDIHSNFWAAEFDMRTGLIDEIIMPPGQRTDADFHRVAERVLTRLFPDGEKYSAEAKELVELYIDEVPKYQRSLVISALMAATQQSEESKKTTTIGERLAMILERMGPAETKLGQVIHSSPNTPWEIRDGMGHLKTEAAIMTRWDLFKHYGDVIPEDLKKRIKGVKGHLGSASYFVTYEVEMEVEGPDGKKTIQRRALSLLRPHALNRAKTGFRVMRRIAEKLARTRKVFNALIPMVKQAESMADVETDWKANMAQSEDAGVLYKAAEVKIGDRAPFKFKVIKTHEAGESYRVMDIADGVHFNELPEETAKEKSYKQDAARALVALELSRILRGGKFDHDRHEGQLKILGDTIYLYDWGAMATDDQLPTREERRLLADVLYEGLMNFDGEVAENKFGDHLFKLIQEEVVKNKPTSEAHIRAQEGVSDYLIRVQKAVVALGQFFKYLEPGDIQDIVKGVMEEGKLHGDFSFRVFEKIQEEAADKGITDEAGFAKFVEERFESFGGADKCKNALVRITGN